MSLLSRPVKPRSYDASSRRIASSKTRERILDEAEALLVERGYTATTIADVAAKSEVHIDSVYRLVGRKPVLLRELIERAISGEAGPVDAEQRDYVQAIRAEPDAGLKLDIYAAAVRAIHERMAPLYLALREAAVTEPEAAEVWKQISDRRAMNMRRFVQDVAEAAGGLRSGVALHEAADTVWAMNSAELYAMLVTERKWSPEQYERWLAQSWRRLLLPED